jgi:uncharacterized protein (TIGR03382 family)
VNQEEKGLAASADSLQARGARVESTEERLGVPSVLWMNEPGVLGNKALATMKAQDAAREHLRAYSDVYRLSSRDVAGAELRNLHDTKRGPLVARFGQSVDGIEVFRNELKVVMNRDNELVAITGYLAPSQTVEKAQLSASNGFRLSAQDAIASAFRDLTGVAISPRSLVAGQVKGAYTSFGFDAASSRLLTWHMEEPARAKKVFFTLPDRLEPAWYVEVNAGPKGASEAAYFSFVVSATDGALLLRNDLSSHSEFTYRVWADPALKIPHDGPHGTEGSPHPTGTPDGYQAPFVAPEFVTLSNYPFSKNDPWLPANATQTAGNNVDAYVDRAAPDGFQPGVDLRANVTAPGVFDYTYDTAIAPNANETQLKAATVNLFYVNNFLHDWFYDAGFDEASGNAQALNFGRGGMEGDSLRAEAQDYGGRNNANMATPSDGSRPRMQMYVFNGVPELKVTSPESLVGIRDSGSASFGMQVFTVTGNVKIPNPDGITEGCADFAADAFKDTIAVIDRGTCNFSIKAYNAQKAGAIAVIIGNNAANQPAPGLGTGTNAELVTIPVLSAAKETVDAWKAEVKANGTPISLSLRRVADLDRDGTLDNDIIAHEWGHYISNRLVGNANGLTNNQGRSMGEGWGDFHALMMMVREQDRNRPGNNMWQGVYSMAGYTQGGGANNGFYYGIRRVPMSTDMTKNGLTLKHIANGTALPASHPMSSTNAAINSEVHNAGEVWATMLWECYASLLNAYPFQEAQDRMKQYLVAGYKATPNAPTFLEARDALLAVTAATDMADYQRFLNAFAKRGAGLGAKVSDRESQDHIGVVESFSTGANLSVLSVRLDDTATGCDKDGVLDLGELGVLTVKIVNTGGTELSPFTATVASDSTTASLAFPEGNQLSFPALKPNQTGTAKLKVSLTAVPEAATAAAGLKITFNEPSLPASARDLTYNPRVHYDLMLGGGTTDTAETELSTLSSSLLGSNPAWKAMGEHGSRYYHVDNPSTARDLTFTTPWLQVAPTGNFIFTFKTRYSFESNNGAADFWDGGVIELTTDGITWRDLFTDLGVNPGYTNFLTASDNPLGARAAFVGLSTGFPGWVTRGANLGTKVAGQKVRLRFRVGSDGGAGAYGWDIDDLAFANVTNNTFAQMVPETSDGSVCTQRPVAHTGLAQTVAEGTLTAQGDLNRTTITLDGSGSFDPEGQALTYAWTQLSGPVVTLSADNVARPSFTADVPASTMLTFQLIVNDGMEASLPQQVQVRVNNVNRPPKALATAQATVDERSGVVVALDGSGSTDADGETLTYSWKQVSGPEVMLTNGTKAAASFTPPEVSANSQLTFALTVSDGAASATSQISVTVNNVDRAPVANAGEDRTVNARTSVTLAGSATDEDGDAITYAWTQVSGETVALEGANTATPTFLAPDVRQSTQLVFQLVTTAKGVQSAPDNVTVSVQKANRRPVVQGPNAMEVNERMAITLAADGIDPDGDAVSYQWVRTGGPEVQLVGANTASLTFTTPEVLADTLMTFQLKVVDPDSAESDIVTASVTVKNVNRMPVVSVGSPMEVDARSRVQLKGSATDADGDAVTYAWTQVSGEAVTLEGADTATPTFLAPDVRTATPAELVFKLVGSDKDMASEPALVLVSVRKANRRPVVVGPNALQENERTRLTLAAEGTDPDGDAVSYSWSQLAGPAVTLEGADTANLSFTTPEVLGNTVLTFRLHVKDADQAESESVLVNLTVKDVNRAPVSKPRKVAGSFEGKDITLDASASSDPDGDALTYKWEQTDGPPVTLSSTNAALTTFTPRNITGATNLTFVLTVTDSRGMSSTETLKVTVLDVGEPLAEAGGCSSTGSGSSSMMSLLLLVGGLVLSRRRKAGNA